MHRPVSRRVVLSEFVGLCGLVAGCAARQRPLPDFVDVIARVSPSVVSIRGPMETVGSGFLVGPGIIVTADHVLQAAGASPQVVIAGVRHVAKTLRRDATMDVALLQVEGPSPPVLSLALSESVPRVGQWIVVVGNPFGAGVTAAVGIVSAAVGSITASSQLARQLQINASVNPGNSGGPVCDARGQVVGVATGFVPGGPGVAFVAPAPAVRSLLSRG